jgi:ubiquinone/menaquinone biosynthesis C-methylase UbiE
MTDREDPDGAREARVAARLAAHRMPASMAPQTEGKMVHWARLYDLGTSLLSLGRLAALHRKIVELAGISSGEWILDVGCGPGRLAIVAASVAGPAAETCGIDPAPEMVALARRKAARAGVRVRFEVGVIEALPYPDDHFDVVLSSLMLHHLPDEVKRRGLAEIHRVLRPAGRLVAVDFGATPAEGLGHLLCVLGLRKGWNHAERL